MRTQHEPVGQPAFWWAWLGLVGRASVGDGVKVEGKGFGVSRLAAEPRRSLEVVLVFIECEQLDYGASTG